ncbi:MAG TPA: hypothetical protein VGD71_17015 [Kribbella sp.]
MSVWLWSIATVSLLGDEARSAVRVGDAEFFLGFSVGRRRQGVVRLDVASGRDPALSVDVVDQQSASVAWVDQGDAGHEVGVWVLRA